MGWILQANGLRRGSRWDGGFYQAVPLMAARAAPQPFQALLATLLTDKYSPGMGFIHKLTLLDFR